MSEGVHGPTPDVILTKDEKLVSVKVFITPYSPKHLRKIPVEVLALRGEEVSAGKPDVERPESDNHPGSAI